jgi:hypothetical protein
MNRKGLPTFSPRRRAAALFLLAPATWGGSTRPLPEAGVERDAAPEQAPRSKRERLCAAQCASGSWKIGSPSSSNENKEKARLPS